MADAEPAELAGDGGALVGGRCPELVAEPAIAGVDPQHPARLGVDEGQLTDIDELTLAGVDDLDGQDRVSRGDRGQLRAPVERSPEVGDRA